MRLVLSLVFVAWCTAAELAQPAPKETPIVDAAAGADFVARSEVEGTSSPFRLANSIHNKAMAPLAVHWAAGGFYCAGSSQIPPGATQKGKTSGDWMMNPTLVPSDLKYGAKHQYPHKADVYIEPKAPASAHVSEAEYYLEDEGKRRSRRIAVTARRDGEGAMLSVEMPSGMLLAMPRLLADSVRQAQEIKTGIWKDLGVVKPAGLALQDGTFGDVAARMFGSEGAQLISGNAPAGQTVRLTARQTGVTAAPRRVYFAMIDQQRTSVFAFSVYVFAQSAARQGR